MKYILVVATDRFVVTKEGTQEELNKIVYDTFKVNRYYFMKEDGCDRFIPIERIAFMDILTETEFKKRIEEARQAQNEAQEEAPKQSGKDNVLVFPPKYRR